MIRERALRVVLLLDSGIGLYVGDLSGDHALMAWESVGAWRYDDD